MKAPKAPAATTVPAMVSPGDAGTDTSSGQARADGNASRQNQTAAAISKVRSSQLQPLSSPKLPRTSAGPNAAPTESRPVAVQLTGPCQPGSSREQNTDPITSTDTSPIRLPAQPTR